MLVGMTLVMVLFLSGQALVPDMAAAEGLRISLREEASIASSKVLLKDVADLRGPDRQEIEKLAQTVVMESPVFGETAVLNRHQIGKLVQAIWGPLPAGMIAGASAVHIRIQGRQITAEEIGPAIKSHILQTTPWKESEIAIRSIGSLKGIELPPAGAQYRIPASGALVGSKNVLVPLEIMQDGRSLRNYWITAEIGIRAEVLTASRRISPGKTITPEDIEKKLSDIPDMRAPYARDQEEVVGKVSRRGLFPGVLLTREVFADPLLVNSGETVRLRLERDGVALTSLAKAQQNGRLGDLIRVRSLDFSTFLKARVSGRAEVRMQ